MKSYDAINRRFAATTIKHTIFENVCQSLLHHIQTAIPGQVLMVVGPTGVGKTRLAKVIQALLRTYVDLHSGVDVGWPVRVEVPPPTKAGFARTAFYHRILSALNEPGVENKVDFDEAVESLREENKFITKRSISASSLGDVVDKALNERNPVALLIDEFGQLTRSRETAVNAASLDVLKGHANMVRTKIILFGTYEDFQKLYFTPQLGRRVRIVHFPRYRETVDDLGSFSTSWKDFESRLEVPFSKAVAEDVEYVHRHSLGCMGTLLEWTRSATIRMHEKKAKVLKREHLEFARPNRFQIEAVKKTLGLEELFDEEGAASDVDSDLIEEEPPASKRTKGSRNPGTRNPQRDPFGDGPVA